MKRFPWKRRLVLLSLCVMLPVTAWGETVLFTARKTDAENAAESIAALKKDDAGVSVAVLEKLSPDKVKTKLEKELTEAGAGNVYFLGYGGVAESKATEALLTKKWMSDDALAKAATVLRQAGADRVAWFAEDDMTHAFLGTFAEKAAEAAGNPLVTDKNNKTDTYLTTVTALCDGKTGEVTEIAFETPQERLRALWGDTPDPELTGIPETDADGFLIEEGVWYTDDDENGVWAYVTDSLRIVITRQKTKDQRWYEADIRRKDGADALKITESLSGKSEKAWVLARETRPVLAVNTDYYHIRRAYKKTIGLIVRNGELLSEAPAKTSLKSMPSFDSLLLTEDGGFEVYTAGTLDGETALRKGARDVLSFGPAMLVGGKLRLLLTGTKTKAEPRTAIGMIEKNHYLIVVAEGRLSYSKGMSLLQLQQLLCARGCREAINLDGGHTSALFFLGKRLNTIGDLSGTGTSSPRTMQELLTIGTAPEEIPMAEGHVISK